MTSLVANEATLHIAAEENNVAEIKRLLSLGADVNLKDEYDRTALHMAAIWNKKNSHFESIELLLKNGADVNVQDKNKNTPIQCLIDEAEVEIVELLLKFGADPSIWNDNDEFALLNAIAKNKIKIFKLLLDHDSILELVKIKSKLSALLCMAASHNDDESHFEICELLLKKGADVNGKTAMGNSSLHYLVRNSNSKTVQLFLDYKADVNVKNDYAEIPLFCAVKNSNLEAVQLLIDHGSDVKSENFVGSTLLHYAGEYGCSVEIIRILLKKGLDINALDLMEKTPLILCLLKENPDPASLTLLLKYADINIIDSEGKNVLSYDYGELFWKVVLEYIAKMHALDIFLHPSILNSISNSKEKKSYFEKCTKELAEAKGTKLQGCWITFFNLLADSKKKLKNYAGNKDLIKQFENGDCKNKFPIYEASMKKNVFKGITQRIYFDSSAGILSDLIPILNPTHLIIRDLLDLLKLKELFKLNEN